MQTWMKRLISAALCLSLLAGTVSGVYALEPEEPEQESALEAQLSEEAVSEENAPVLEEMWITAPMDEEDSDALLWNYLRSRSGLLHTQSTVARDNLPPNERIVYDQLAPQLKSVAKNGGSSKIPVDLSKLTGNSLDVSLVHRALLLDMPYDLYWYDKTEGMHIYPDGVFVFQVVRRYRDGSSLRVTSAVSGISEAVENAAAIVAKHSDKTDYAKLDAYCQEICDLTQYNFDAIEDTYLPTYGYGDPWQLIYVFDGKPSTNVVCEGYSKAFQYLCDLSKFKGDTRCITVTGDLNGGGHMWNVVRMGGVNYLADITNCDEGTAGYPRDLFLCGMTAGTPSPYRYWALDGFLSYDYDAEMFSVYTEDQLALSAEAYISAPIPHVFEYTVTKTPSLSAAGTLTGSCLHCDEHPTVTLPALNETDYSVSVVQASTCAAEGIAEYTWKTTTYGTLIFRVNLPKTAHKYSGYTVTAEPTEKTTGTLTGTCTCGDTVTVTLPALSEKDYTYRVVTAATCAAEGVGEYTWKTTTYGTFSFRVSLPKLAHTYTYAVSKEPTEKATGTLTGTCTCGDTVTVTLPVLNKKDYTTRIAEESTCVKAGRLEYTWSHADCGEFTFSVELPLGKHNYSDGKCTVCGADAPVEPEVLLGDVNSDGKVNGLDRLILNRWLKHWGNYPDSVVNSAAADLNGDGEVTAADAVILSRYLAKWEAYQTLPVPMQ